MPTPHDLPFGQVSLISTTSRAASRSWQLPVTLSPERSFLFFGLMVLGDGPEGNDQVAVELTHRLQDTIRYHQQVLTGHKVSLTNEDFFEQCLQKMNAGMNVFLRDVNVALPVQTWAIAVGMLAPDSQPDRWQVFISRFGEINAWLLHKAQLDTYKLLSIFDSPDPITGAPGAQKYFKNIVSSSLSNQDQLLFCTPNIFNYVSLTDTKKFLTELSAKASMMQLENILRDHLQDPVAAAFTLKLSPYKQTAGSANPAVITGSKTNEAAQSMQDLISTQSQTERILGSTTGFSLKQAGNLFKGALERFKQTSAKPSGQSASGPRQPTIKGQAGPVMQALISVQVTLGKGLSMAQDAWSKRRGSTPMGKSEYVAVHGTVSRVSQWRTTTTRLTQPLLALLKRGLGSQGGWKNLIRNPRLYVALVILIGGGFIASHYYQNRKTFQAQVANASTNLETVKAALDRVDSYLIVGREADATVLSQQAKDTLLLISDDLTQFHDQKAAYLAKIEDQQQRLRKEIHIDTPVTLIDDLRTRLNAPAAYFAKSGDSLVIVGSDPHTILDFNLKTKQPSSKTVSTDLTQVDAMTRDEGTLYLLAGNSMTSVSISKGSATPSVITSAKSHLQAMSVYNSRLYALAPAELQIERSNRLPGFSVFSSWLKDTSPALNQSVDLAIDGSIYVLSKTGLSQYTQGIPVNGFHLDAVDPELTNASALSYQPDNKFFFILENPRLLVFKKTGKFVAQYLIKSPQPLVDVSVDEASSTAYLLTVDQVLTVPLQLSN